MKEKDTKIPYKTTHDEDCGYTVTGRPCNCSCGADDGAPILLCVGADDAITHDITRAKFIVGDNFSVSQKDSTTCDKPMQHLSCPACGVRWIDHLGVEGVCRENARLKEELDNLSADGIHSCHPYCSRPACIARRERDEARAEVARLREALELADLEPTADMECVHCAEMRGEVARLKKQVCPWCEEETK